MNKWHVDYASAKEKDREWKETRRKILKRDRYRCRVQDCHVKGAKNLTVHHIVPRDQGGDNRDLNLITLCPKHHDEIEVAEIRLVPLIEAWEGYDENRTAIQDMTSIILAYTDRDDDSSPDMASKNYMQTTENKKRMPRHRCSDSTVEALSVLLADADLAEVTKSLGYPPQFASTVSAIMHCRPGAISAKREDELRAALGLLPLSPINMRRSEKAPKTDEPVRVLKRTPPVRKKRIGTVSLVEAPAEIAPLVSDIEAEDDDNFSDTHVFLSEDNEWEWSPRSDTTIGVRVRDADWFDTLVAMTSSSKAEMFSEILAFYMEAHHIKFVECTENEYETWIGIYRLVMSLYNPKSPLDARIITEAVADFGVSQNVDLKSIDADFLRSYSDDFAEFVKHWNLSESKRAWTSAC